MVSDATKKYIKDVNESYGRILNDLNEDQYDLYVDGKKVNQKPMDSSETKQLKSFFKKYKVKSIEIKPYDGK